MSAFALNEEIVAALVALLKADLPDAIAAINTDGRALRIPTDREILDYIPSPSELVEFPTVGIQDFPARWSDDTGFSATGEYRQGIVYYCHSDDTRELAQQVRGYGRAILDVVRDPGCLSPAAFKVLRSRWVPGGTLEREERPRTWVTWAAVVIEAHADEDG